jgi:hypothetical protein
MPNVLRDGPYRFFFYSNEGNEPVHVHVRRDDSEAKFWLDPIACADAGDFSEKELKRIESLVEQHRDKIEEKWNGHFRLGN